MLPAGESKGRRAGTCKGGRRWEPWIRYHKGTNRVDSEDEFQIGNAYIGQLEEGSLYQNLPHAQLWIVPGATHFVAMEQPDVVNREVIAFLTTPYCDTSTYY